MQVLRRVEMGYCLCAPLSQHIAWIHKFGQLLHFSSQGGIPYT
jgi:hypothetical protein